MFGYIRPMHGELKVNEFERFKACYCGLCHALGKKYGLISRSILNYELVFLAMLLWDPDESPEYTNRRCIASPFQRKRFCSSNKTLDTCAAYTVILTRWKLLDTISDEKFIKSIPHRILLLLLTFPYKKAAREFPQYDKSVRDEIEALFEYESKHESSLDEAADKFAKILNASIPYEIPLSTRRPLVELLYHLGRWIYIIDACDDLEKDIKNNQYNAIALRYQTANGKLSESELEVLKTTLVHSNNLLSLAFELVPENAWTDIIANVIYLGMPEVCDRVLNGTWTHYLKQRNKEWN